MTSPFRLLSPWFHLPNNVSSYKDFVADVIGLVFPDGEPENLVRPHRSDIIQALIHIQRFCDYYRQRNRDLIPFCATLFSCGGTIVDQPRGRIQRVYTLQGDCCPIFYECVEDYDEWLRWLMGTRPKWTEPLNVGMPQLQSGLKFAETVTNKGKRYNYGKYSLHNNRIYIGHRIESTETVVIEWEGIKRKYADDDIMPFDNAETGDASDAGDELRNTVAAYVRYEHLRKYERSSDWLAEKVVFDGMVADLVYERKRELAVKPQPTIPEYDQPRTAGGCVSTVCASTATDAEDESTVFAFISDAHCNGSQGPTSVGLLVDGWNPEFIISGGDNFRSGGEDTVDFLVNPVLDLYGDYIPDKFDTAIGNHDRDPGARVNLFKNAFWPYPVQRPSGLIANPGYYDKVRGNAHIFFYDAGYDNSQVNQQPDGVDINSKEAGWLRVALARSTADWKIVVLHQPPYTSYLSHVTAPTLDPNGYQSYPALRLPFAAWGANAVLFGHIHAYERMEFDGIPYIQCGTAGGQLVGGFTEIAESKILIPQKFGALRGTMTCQSLKFEFVDVLKNVLDTVELTK